MTAVTQWREPGSGRHWAPVALPEPPRHSHVSKSVPASLDGVGRALEEWIQSLTVASTHDGE
jgi:hypothetical protein